MPIEIETESPPVPGENYKLLIVGKFPGYCDGVPCSSNMLSFYSREKLKATE